MYRLSVVWCFHRDSVERAQVSPIDGQLCPQRLLCGGALTLNKQGGRDVRAAHDTPKEREGFVEVNVVTEFVGFTS